ncbi:MAG TPA: metallophosphoesterase [Gammaproteobacteria bacterium]|nr:metallophosphoesterase [Gammaproteobacteria bacterium]
MKKIATRFCRVLSVALLAVGLAAVANAGDWRFEGVERVVAIGDVHGARDELVALLGDVGLVDAELRWSGGRTHLVSVGDLLDRGDYGRQVMDLLMRLQQEAAAAGGAVHVLLGNHEVMNLTGDLRYVSEGDYAQFGTEARAGLPAGFFERRAALAPEGYYGQWLLGLPVALVVNDTLFVHGGVSQMLEGMSLEQINRVALRDVRRVAEGWHALLGAGVLGDTDGFSTLRSRAAALADDGRDAALQALGREMNEALQGLPFNPDGVLWYRGNSLCHAYAEGETLRKVLAAVGARQVVVGHTVTGPRKITSRVDGLVYRIDTGMNHAAYGGTPGALIIEGGKPLAKYIGAPAAAAAVETTRDWARPYGMSDAELEDFLRTAEVTLVEDLAEGVTRPQRLTLERDGRTMRAVFKTVDTNPGLERQRRWSREHDLADRHIYDVVAYRLDRILGVDMVPVAVEREVNGRSGTAQYWVPNSINENQRRAQEIPRSSDCSFAPQFNIMNAFDLLIFNTDRNLGNILYDEDQHIWLIDHTRAFGTRRGEPAMLRNAQVVITPDLAAMLEQVTEENLEPLKPYLHARQISALVTRAQWLRGRQ